MLSQLWAKARNVLTHPTIEVAFVQSVLSFAISQGLFSLTVEQSGVVMALVAGATGLLAALLTHEALLVWVISLGQAVGALIVTFDLAARFHWNTQTAAAWVGVLVFVLGLVQHGKATPKYGPLAEKRAAVAHKLTIVHPLSVLDASPYSEKLAQIADLSPRDVPDQPSGLSDTEAGHVADLLAPAEASCPLPTGGAA